LPTEYDGREKSVAECPKPRWKVVERILQILQILEQLVRFFGGLR
jgi:hypothetical protein